VDHQNHETSKPQGIATQYFYKQFKEVGFQGTEFLGQNGRK